MKTIGKILLSCAALLVLLATVGSLYQWQAARQDRMAIPAPGELLEVDGLRIHLDCRGSGEPTIVLEAGLGYGASTWSQVHEPLAALTRTCAYDRPGMDWSDPLDHPAGAAEVAERLHRIMAAADLSGPKILVGMSAGGLFVREYFARHPQDIVAMMLVDSSHEQQGLRLPRLDDSALRRSLAICRWLAPIGVVRALSMLDRALGRQQIPASERSKVRANAYQTHYCRAMELEIAGFVTEVGDDRPPDSLGDLPLVVLSRGTGPDPDEVPGLDQQQVRQASAVWIELQTELAGLSSRGQRFVAEHSGHMIQQQQPALVIDKLAELVSKWRQS